MTHMQKIKKWEAAFARYVAALAHFDAVYGQPGKEWGARRSCHAAERNLARVDALVSA